MAHSVPAHQDIGDPTAGRFQKRRDDLATARRLDEGSPVQPSGNASSGPDEMLLIPKPPTKAQKPRKNYRRLEAAMIEYIRGNGMLHPCELAEMFGLTLKKVARAIISAKQKMLLEGVTIDVPYDVARADEVFKKNMLEAGNLSGKALVRIYKNDTPLRITITK
jgi:hypothetical protein